MTSTQASGPPEPNVDQSQIPRNADDSLRQMVESCSLNVSDNERTEPYCCWALIGLLRDMNSGISDSLMLR